MLGGVRRLRADWSESIEDVSHPHFAIEVKYGKQCPKWCTVKHPTSNGEFDLIPSNMWRWGMPTDHFKILCQTRDEFLRKGIAQALSYNPEKIPVLCLKPKGYRGFIVCLRHQDYLKGVEFRFPPQVSPTHTNSTDPPPRRHTSSLGCN